MNQPEFSSEFDLLYNNVSSNQAPGLTEYEKSVFLTKAQDELIKNYFTNVQGGNKYQQGIEDSEKRYADFSALLTVATLNAEPIATTIPFDERGKIFKLPDGTQGSPKTMIVISETFKTGSKVDALQSYQVIPLKFEEYMRLMSKPSTDPLKKQVWKLMGNSESGNGSIEIVPHWKDKENLYNTLILKYIRKPHPIILEDLSFQGLSIEGETNLKIETEINPKRFILSGVLEIEDEGTSPETYPFSLIVDTPTKVGYDLSPENIESFVVNGFDGSTVTLGLSLKDIHQSVIVEASNYTLSGPTEDKFEEGYIYNTSAGYDTIKHETTCELAEELHPEILQRAVELAKIFYTGDNQQVLTAGTRSE